MPLVVVHSYALYHDEYDDNNYEYTDAESRSVNSTQNPRSGARDGLTTEHQIQGANNAFFRSSEREDDPGS